MLRKISIGLLIFMLLSAFILSGCGNTQVTESSSAQGSSSQSSSQAESKPDFSGRTMSLIIGSVTLGDAYNNLFNDFKNDTGIDLDVQVVPGAGPEYTQIVQTKMATKDLPDILVYFSGPLYLNPLNPTENIVEITNQEWLDKVKDGLTDLGASYQGKTYGIPFGGIDFTGLLYNEKVFTDLSLTPPSTFEELVSVSEAILASGKDITPIYEMGKQMGPLSAFIFADVAKDYAADLSVMGKLNTGEIGFEDTFILDSLKRKYELQEKGFFNDDMMSGTWETLFKALSEDKAAMSFVYSNVLPNLYKSYPDTKVKLIPLNDVAVSVFTQAMYIMKTENQDMSAEFFNYFLQDSTLTKLYDNLKSVPAYKGIEGNPDAALSPMIEALGNGNVSPAFFDQLVVNVGQAQLIAEMHTNTKTPEEVSIDLTKKLKQLAQEMGLPGFD